MTRAAWGWIAASGVFLACGGCGFKGPLYLPERNATVVTHPAPGAQGEAAPAGQTQTPPPAGKNNKRKSQSSPPPPAPQTPPPPAQ